MAQPNVNRVEREFQSEPHTPQPSFPHADNDNERSAANDNTPYPEQRPSAQRVEVIRDNPVSSIGTGAKTAGTTARVTGATLKTTGTGFKAAGKAMDVGGTALMRGGAALSSTGAGAIVGIPTIALGAGIKAAGTGTKVAGTTMNKAGKATSIAGRNLQKTGRSLNASGRLPRAANILESKKLQKVLKRAPLPAAKLAGYGLDSAAKIWERKEVTRANGIIFSTGFSLWLGVQLPLAIFNLASLGAAFAFVTVQDKVRATSAGIIGDTATYYLGKAYDYTIGAALSVTDKFFTELFGFPLTAAFDPTSYFIGTYYLVVLVGWATLLLAATIYIVSMVNPFTGKGWQWKMGGFLIATIGYIIPGLNILPWFAVWTLAVWKNPE